MIWPVIWVVLWALNDYPDLYMWNIWSVTLALAIIAWIIG